ncbi:TorF family putative porin [Amphritea balenae]|uniref:Porin n=1 Tax=Amphritea balenae TaxID=452629 RepID=A0A3P1SWB9_9GAMM|nr:TorF family putative porin [Amphritea balenae]RRD01265.1 hypothetical protein EHS89_01500 [Amphritea balenae]GGK58609.1 TIGR02001 family outer membrane protein [Amphritea balenae]
MKKILTGLVAAMALTTTVQAAEFSATITATSDYRFRGISQTMSDPALQGSIDVAFENGAYIGAWATNVDFDDDADSEIDYYAGYYNDINDDMAYDIMLAYYTYQGYSSADDSDYLELMGSLYYGDITLGYAYANDYINSGDDYSYISADYSYGLSEEVSLDLHAGHSFGDAADSYEDYSVGLSTSFEMLDVSVAYLFNDIDGPTTDNLDDNTVVLSISTTF